MTTSEIDLEQELFLYDPVSGTKLLVPIKDLIEEYRTYYDFKVYETLGQNIKVGQWLKDRKLIENEKPVGRI